jgi:hypothetical protein
VSGIVRDGRKLYSQGLEELLIRDFFHDQRDGTFLMWAAPTTSG